MLLTSGWQRDVRKFIHAADLIGIAFAARDEYSDEADDIISLIAEAAGAGEALLRQDIHDIVVDVFLGRFDGLYWSPHKTAALVDSICSRLCIADGIEAARDAHPEAVFEAVCDAAPEAVFEAVPVGDPGEGWVSVAGLVMRRLRWNDDGDLVPVEW
jgi:ATP phosphoribosyltransferase regulatory subunit HisZ